MTEPNAGLNTSAITTKAERTDNGYVVHGQKMWTTTAQRADKLLLLARTTPREECKRAFDGITLLFYTDLDRNKVEIREIAKMGRKCVDTNALFIDGLEIREEDQDWGRRPRGFYYLLDGLNPERCLIAAEAIGIGRCALDRAANYARERVVFDRPIGQNQGNQHPPRR